MCFLSARSFCVALWGLVFFSAGSPENLLLVVGFETHLRLLQRPRRPHSRAGGGELPIFIDTNNASNIQFEYQLPPVTIGAFG